MKLFCHCLPTCPTTSYISDPDQLNPIVHLPMKEYIFNNKLRKQFKSLCEEEVDVKKRIVLIENMESLLIASKFCILHSNSTMNSLSRFWKGNAGKGVFAGYLGGHSRPLVCQKCIWVLHDDDSVHSWNWSQDNYCIRF